MNVIIINGFDRLGDSALQAKAELILTSLAGNAYFPAPTPTLSVLSDALAAYKQAFTASATNASPEVADKNALKKTLVAVLRALRNYVQMACEDDRARALTSGFTLAKERAPRITKAPDWVRLAETGTAGEMEAAWNRVPTANSYQVDYRASTTDGEVRGSVSVTTRRCVLSNLPPLAELRVEVTAIGSRGQRMTSQPVYRTTQALRA